MIYWTENQNAKNSVWFPNCFLILFGVFVWVCVRACLDDDGDCCGLGAQADGVQVQVPDHVGRCPAAASAAGADGDGRKDGKKSHTCDGGRRSDRGGCARGHDWRAGAGIGLGLEACAVADVGEDALPCGLVTLAGEAGIRLDTAVFGLVAAVRDGLKHAKAVLAADVPRANVLVLAVA